MVALVGLVKDYKMLALSNYEIAELAYSIEREDLAISGGLQDQYAASFGGFNFIEFDRDRVIVNPLRIHKDTINELEHNLLLCYTGKSRRSDHIIDDQTQRLVSNAKDTVDALAQQKELAVAMKNALLTGRLDDFGDLMDLAWHTKKKVSSRISNLQIDEFYEEARKKGAMGGKITGAGGGGFMMFYCEFQKRHLVAEQLRRMGAVAAEFAFEPNGLQTWRADDARSTQ